MNRLNGRLATGSLFAYAQQMDAGELGRRIQEWRLKAGLDAHELANIAGMDVPSLQSVEMGHRHASTSELAALAAGIGISPLAILDEHSLPARFPVQGARKKSSS